MSAKRMLIVLACLGVVAGCGSDPASNASSKEKTFEEALGMDEASQQAREAKVQEAVRTCMKAEGFDYIPVDPEQFGRVMRFGGADGAVDLKERKKSGYGITTGFQSKRRATPAQGQDPNQKIREALSAADKKAYDTALMGAAAAEQRADGSAGGVRVIRRAGDSTEAGPPQDQGCFGKAQASVPDGPREFQAELDELRERAVADPRIIEAERSWAACMADRGYTDFEKPDDAPQYVMGKMDTLMGAEPQGDGVTKFAIGGDDIDQAALATLRDEEIDIAVADGTCQEKTGYMKVENKVRAEYEQRFLDEHPDLTSGS